jgi:hypothetical protein
MKPFAVLAGILMLACAVPAAAQTDSQPTSPCQAQPDQNKNSGNNAGQTGEQRPPAGGSLTQKLDPCDGVLTPPPTGDSGMTEPAPNQGKTPVIKPGEVPQQPPKQ